MEQFGDKRKKGIFQLNCNLQNKQNCGLLRNLYSPINLPVTRI